MKFFRLDLLTLLISLFILNSCKRQDGIGLGVNDQNEINGNLIVDTNIVINTVVDDTAARALTPLGPVRPWAGPPSGSPRDAPAPGSAPAIRQ